MSDTEVTVSKSVSGQWWRMEYRGKVEFCDEEPSADDCRDFRKSVDQMARSKRVEEMAMRRVNGHGSTIREEPYNS